MKEMSDDESFAYFACLGLAFIALYFWYRALFSCPSPRVRTHQFLLALLPWPVYLALFGILRLSAAADVKNDRRYLALFMFAGVALTGAAQHAAWLMGIGIRDDIIERRNPAAPWAIAGTLLGMMACYAGANIGEGATIWTTLWPAAVAIIAWTTLWFLLEYVARLSSAITVDRDTASALRLAATLFATGLILGRAMAGNFTTTEATLREFAQRGWPAVLITIAAAALQKPLGPNPQSPHRHVLTAGILPASLLLLSAGAWLVYLGAW